MVAVAEEAAVCSRPFAVNMASVVVDSLVLHSTLFAVTLTQFYLRAQIKHPHFEAIVKWS